MHAPTLSAFILVQSLNEGCFEFILWRERKRLKWIGDTVHYLRHTTTSDSISHQYTTNTTTMSRDNSFLDPDHSIQMLRTVCWSRCWAPSGFGAGLRTWPRCQDPGYRNIHFASSMISTSTPLNELAQNPWLGRLNSSVKMVPFTEERSNADARPDNGEELE